jgi:hypothetical protein
MISDDSVVHPDTLANGVRHFDREIANGHRLGAVAFYWRSWPEEKQYRVSSTLGNKTMVNHGLFLREAVERVGWIDDARYDFYCADGDLALKIWHAGYEIVTCSDALLEHFERVDYAVRQQNLTGLDSDWSRYLDRWTGIYYDPAQPCIGEWTSLESVSVRSADHLFPSGAANEERSSAVRPLTALAKAFWQAAFALSRIRIAMRSIGKKTAR